MCYIAISKNEIKNKWLLPHKLTCNLDGSLEIGLQIFVWGFRGLK